MCYEEFLTQCTYFVSNIFTGKKYKPFVILNQYHNLQCNELLPYLTFPRRILSIDIVK